MRITPLLTCAAVLLALGRPALAAPRGEGPDAAPSGSKGGAADLAPPAPADGGTAAAAVPFATPTISEYPSGAAALSALLAQGPRVLAFGEFHETLSGPKVASSLRRFTDELLPLLAGPSSDLVIETWLSQGDCGKKEEAVVADVAKTTQRPQATEDEIVTMVRRAKEAGVVPHALNMSCADYKTVYTPQGVDYDQMLTVLTRELRGQVERVLARRDPRLERRLVLVYGGALHNDLYPRAELSRYTFGPPLRERLGPGYMEIDVFVPEYIQRSAALRKEPWYAPAQRRPGKTLLIQRGPGSYILLFPRTRR